MKKLHIILDMDGTLIDGDVTNVHPRPYLRKFLNYCFTTFKSVSIWTAAHRDWYETVYNKCLKNMLGENKFNIVYTEDRCTVKTLCNFDILEYKNSNLTVVKPLKKLWRSKNTGMTRDNTLIVDDTYETYQENYGNAIPIPTYTISNHLHKHDKMLLLLMLWLPTLKNKQIRKIEKRGWYNKTIPRHFRK